MQSTATHQIVEILNIYNKQKSVFPRQLRATFVYETQYRLSNIEEVTYHNVLPVPQAFEGLEYIVHMQA